MAGLVPFNRRNGQIVRTGAGFEDFFNVLDDFFTDGALPGRNLLRDTFKIDIQDKEGEYLLEAELPGIRKDEVDINIEEDSLCISINRTEDTNNEGKNYIHRERRIASMSRRVRLSGVDLANIKAKMEDGVLTVAIPKEVKTAATRKVAIE